jgi:hypothetical protein
MAIERKHAAMIDKIVERYGSVIDLKKQPGVLLEILRAYAGVIAQDGVDGAGGAPPGPTTSSIAVAGPGTPKVELHDLLAAVQHLAAEFRGFQGAVLQRLERGAGRNG